MQMAQPILARLATSAGIRQEALLDVIADGPHGDVGLITELGEFEKGVGRLHAQ